MLTLLVAFVASCSNDEIEVTTTAKTHTLTYNVHTQGMYDGFGISDYVREYNLRTKDYALGVTTYVYDNKGSLVDSVFNFSYAFGTVTQTFKQLPEGRYTIVTIETLVSPYNKFKADCFYLTGGESLETLRLAVTKGSYLGHPDAIGVSTEEINLAEEKTLSVTPAAIGSLICLHYRNFENSTHEYIGFYTKDYATGYSLNPSLTRSQRFTYDYTETGYVVMRHSVPAQNPYSGYFTIYVLDEDIYYCLGYSDAGDETDDGRIWHRSAYGSATLENGAVYYAGYYYMGDSSESKGYFGNATGLADFLNSCQSELSGSSTKAMEEPSTPKASMTKTMLSAQHLTR